MRIVLRRQKLINATLNTSSLAGYVLQQQTSKDFVLLTENERPISAIKSLTLPIVQKHITTALQSLHCFARYSFAHTQVDRVLVLPPAGFQNVGACNSTVRGVLGYVEDFIVVGEVKPG